MPETIEDLDLLLVDARRATNGPAGRHPFPGAALHAPDYGGLAAQQRGVVFGRRPGQRVKADRFAPKVLKLVAKGQSYREISHRLGLSKNTVLDIVKRDRAP